MRWHLPCCARSPASGAPPAFGGRRAGRARYERANAAYAERIIESISPDGTVWIHGDRWLLVAPALRQLGHRGPIGLVLEAPFPAPQRLAGLPWHGEVMAALCALDLLGLRTPECVQRFEASRARAGQRRGPRLAVFPEGRVAPSQAPAPGWVPRFLELLGGGAPHALIA